MTIQRRLAATAAAAVVGLTTLSGCGGDLGPDLHPGAAAVVGDTSISLDEVDAKAKALCRFGVESGQLQNEVPMASVRTSYVQEFVQHALAEQYVAHVGAADDPALVAQVKEARAQVDAQVEGLEPALRPIFEEMAAKASYVEIVKAIGGDDYVQWASGVDVVRDPRFPALDDQGMISTSGDLSVPVSDLSRAAVAAQGQEEYDSYLASLPASQKCGTAPDA